MALRWGIVSSGKISNDFVSALQTLPKSDHEIIAVGARSLSSADSFAKTHNIPNAYEGYDKIAQNTNIDIVYIGNLNPQHFEVSKLMLEHGKHILCEKPWTLNQKQTRRLVEIARSKKLFAMEAVWSRFFPVYHELRTLLTEKAVGDIIHVTASFGFPLTDVERLKSKDLGGGTILDLGVYTLQFQQLVFNAEQPLKILADGKLNQQGVDETMNAILRYDNGRSAVVSTSSRAQLPNEGVIVGTKGIIKVPHFWCPTQLITPEKTYTFSLPQSDGNFFFDNSVGLSYQAEHVRQCIKEGKIESPFMPHEQSLQLAYLMDTLRQQLGVVFPEDSKDF